MLCSRYTLDFLSSTVTPFYSLIFVSLFTFWPAVFCCWAYFYFYDYNFLPRASIIRLISYEYFTSNFWWWLLHCSRFLFRRALDNFLKTLFDRRSKEQLNRSLFFVKKSKYTWFYLMVHGPFFFFFIGFFLRLASV